MSEIDHDTALRVAQEALAQTYEAFGMNETAEATRLGLGDADHDIQAIILALTHGTDLLKPAEPVEPPEVTAAREVAGTYERNDEAAVAEREFLRGVEWARKQEGK